MSFSPLRLYVPFAEELEEEKESPTETDLTEKQKHQLRHRELFLSRQYESLPATHIRYCTKTCTPHHLPAVLMDSHSSSHEQTNQALLTSCVCVLHAACSLPLSLLGGSAVSHYWMRLKLFFHTLTKRWVGQNKKLICHLLLGIFCCRIVMLYVLCQVSKLRERLKAANKDHFHCWLISCLICSFIIWFRKCQKMFCFF